MLKRKNEYDTKSWNVWSKFWNERIPGYPYLIHHVDRNPKNNEITNLALVTVYGHAKMHKPPREVTLKKLSKYFNAYGMTMGELSGLFQVSESTIRDLIYRPELVISALGKLRSWGHDGERRLTATEVLMKERDVRWD